MEIVLIVIAFISLLLLTLWLPFFKSTANANDQQNIRDETNVELYQEHKAEIEKDYSDGAIDEENYQYLLAELDKCLLQDIAMADKVLVAPTTNKPLSVYWPIFLSVFILAFTVALYLKQGTLTALLVTPAASQAQQQGPMSAEQQARSRQKQMFVYINKLQLHLEKQPDDSEAWYKLGQTLVGASEFEQALAAYQQVIAIEGEHADLLGAMAQAHYYANNQQINVIVQDLIDRALVLDINDPSTNILLGMHNFISQEYQLAIDHWQRVIKVKRQGVNVAALQQAVIEAQSRLGISASEQTKVPAITGPQLTVSVSLSAEISAQLAQEQDKVVFVYAIPTDGRRMPLAALKLMASDLPKVVTLNNTNAMSAQSNLSSVSKVHLFAIVSKQGGAGIKPGDFKAEVNNVAIDKRDTISLVIDKLVE